MMAVAPVTRQRSPMARAWAYVASFDGFTKAAIWVLAALILFALLGSWFGLGGSPTDIVGRRLQPPSLAFPAGTDNLGRPLLPRLLPGFPTTLLLSAAAVVLSALIATGSGGMAG